MKHENQILCDVVVVNYNTGLVLEKCLEKLFANKETEFNLIVVDNASNDNSLHIAKDLLTNAHVIRNKKNSGFAKACNQAAKCLNSKYIIFLNPDCFVQSNSLEKLITQIKQQKKAGIVGCCVNNMDGSEQRGSRRRLPTFFRIMFTWTKLESMPLFKGMNLHANHREKGLMAVEAVNGACYIISRQVFEQLQGFDESFPLHFEDLDLFKRVLGADYHIYFDPDITVKHIKGHSSSDQQQIKQWKKTGIIRYFEKHQTKLSASIIKLLCKII